MKVAVDARLLRGGGIGRFVREVTGPWVDREDIDDLTFLGDAGELEAWLHGRSGLERVRIVHWPDPPYSARAQMRIAGDVARALRGAEVRFFPHYDAPIFSVRRPSVVVVHDLTQFQPGAPFPLHKRVLGARLMRSVVRRATRIVTVSHNSARDIAARVPQVEELIRVVRPGVSDAFRGPREGASDDRYAWQSSRPYLLTVGKPRPHKRIDFAVDLLADLRQEGWEDLMLIAVGASGGPCCPVSRRALERNVSASVLTLGSVDDRTLRDLYEGAEALLFPSLYEGFGLPVAEAGALGCPVIASNRGSIPEAADGRAVLLDPFDLAGWKRAFLEMKEGNGHRGLNGNGNGRGHLNANGSGACTVHASGPSSWSETSASVITVLQEAVEVTAKSHRWAIPSGRSERSGRTEPAWPFKRIMDVLLALGGLVLASPVLLASAAAVYLSSGRPILFGHLRCGLRGRDFRCLKFRTMVHDAEALLDRSDDLRATYLRNGYKVPRARDPRVTRVGHFLRYTHVDELPQLVNVLRGDMSLVGPRPVVPTELEEYGADSDTLLSVRPGVFGPWTAMGKSRPSYPERAEVELSYVRDHGLLRDLEILARNVPVLLWGQSDE